MPPPLPASPLPPSIIRQQEQHQRRPFSPYPAYCFSLSPTFTTWARLTVSGVHEKLHSSPEFQGQNIYFHAPHQHPIKWIRLIGIIVALDIYEKRWVAALDDSSGATIELSCARRRPSPTGSKQQPFDKNGNKEAITENAIALKEPELQSQSINVGQRQEAPKAQEDEIGTTATGRALDLTGFDVGSVVKAKGGLSTFRGVKQLTLERLTHITSTTAEARAWAENTAFRRDVLDRPWVVSVDDQRNLKKEAEGREDGETGRRKRREKKEERRRERKRAHEEDKKKETREGRRMDSKDAPQHRGHENRVGRRDPQQRG